MIDYTHSSDPAARPRAVAITIAQAALQAAARAMHAAQMAADRMAAAGMPAEAQALGAFRDAICDAYAAVPETVRSAILRAPGTIGGDELLDLLAGMVSASVTKPGDRQHTQQG
jgi:hypothetical protein